MKLSKGKSNNLSIALRHFFLVWNWARFVGIAFIWVRCRMFQMQLP